MKLSLTLLSFLFFSVSVKIIAQEQTKDKNIVRVLTFNIKHGATADGDFNLDEIADVIKKANPDLVALQEVDFQTNRAQQLDLTTELALRTNMTSFYAKAMDYDGGGYGEGILSKFTFLKARNFALPHQPSSEPRAAAEVTVVIPSGDTIQFVGTHLDHQGNNKDRLMQVKAINKEFIDGGYPSILTGDLNDTPGSNPIRILESKWGSAYDEENPEPTFPATNPEIKIDYVMFYPKIRWKVLNTEVICNPKVTDHCGYLVVLELLPEP